MVVVPPPLRVERMLTPGAQVSTQEPCCSTTPRRRASSWPLSSRCRCSCRLRRARATSCTRVGAAVARRQGVEDATRGGPAHRVVDRLTDAAAELMLATAGVGHAILQDDENKFKRRRQRGRPACPRSSSSGVEGERLEKAVENLPLAHEDGAAAGECVCPGEL